MSEICPTCGLPRDLCICEIIAKEKQRITVNIVKRRFGKLTTLIKGINEKDIKLKDIAKKLKTALACGGTAKGGVIELQGNHLDRIKDELVKIGFSPDTIDIKGFRR